MNKHSLVFAFLFLSIASAAAQDFKPIKFEEYKLKNGLTVLLHVDRSAPTAMTYLLYKVGSKDEVPGRTGFAHFFEHLMFEGTDNIKRGTIDKLITSAGGVLNASTSFDKTDYFFKVPINQLELALWIESDRMNSLVIDSLGIETQRKVVKEELKQRYEGRPFGTLFDNLFKNTFKGTQYEWTPIGVPEDINRASKKEFIDFHHKYYLPNNACLVVGGDLDIAKTKKWIEQYFGSIPAGPDPERVKIAIPAQSEERKMVVEEKVTPLPAYLESYITVDQRHPDAYALEFLGNVLSSGRSSRLYQRLVDKDQIALQAGSFPIALDKSGMFAFFCIANRGVTIAQLRPVIAEEIEKVKKEGITEQEFQKLRNEKEAEFISGLTSLDGKLRRLASYQLFDGDANLINNDFKRYMAVTRDDIKRVANTYIQPQRKNMVEYVVMDATN